MRAKPAIESPEHERQLLALSGHSPRVWFPVGLSLTESLGKAQALWQVYQQKLAEARRRDAQEGESGEALEGRWVASR